MSEEQIKIDPNLACPVCGVKFVEHPSLIPLCRAYFELVAMWSCVPLMERMRASKRWSKIRKHVAEGEAASTKQSESENGNRVAESGLPQA